MMRSLTHKVAFQKAQNGLLDTCVWNQPSSILPERSYSFNGNVRFGSNLIGDLGA